MSKTKDNVTYRGRNGKTKVGLDSERAKLHYDIRHPYTNSAVDKLKKEIHNALDHQFSVQSRGQLASPHKFDSRYNYETYKYDYYSGSQAKVFLGDIWVDDIVTIQYNIRQSKEPIYGYASQNYDAVAAGQIIGQGSMVIAFKEVGYLNVIKAYLDEQAAGVKLAIANIKNRSAGGDSDVYSTSDYSARVTGSFNPGLIRQSENIETVLDKLKNADLKVETSDSYVKAEYGVKGSTADKDIVAAKRIVTSNDQRKNLNNNVDFNSGHGNKIKDFEDASEVLEDVIWGDNNGKPFGLDQKKDGLLRADEFDYVKSKTGEFNGIKSARGNNYEDVMNILITFGDMSDKRAEHTLYLLNDIHFTSQNVIVSPTGEPIGEVYEFFFRDINKTINTSSININKIKFNVGVEEGFYLSQLEDVYNAINNKQSTVTIKLLTYYDGKKWNKLDVSFDPMLEPLGMPPLTIDPKLGKDKSLNNYVQQAISDYLSFSSDIDKSLNYEKLSLTAEILGINGVAEDGAMDVTGLDLTKTNGINMIAERQGEMGFNFIIVSPGSNPSLILDIIKREDFFTPSAPVLEKSTEGKAKTKQSEGKVHIGNMEGGLGETTRTEPDKVQITRDDSNPGTDEEGKPLTAKEIFETNGEDATYLDQKPNELLVASVIDGDTSNVIEDLHYDPLFNSFTYTTVDDTGAKSVNFVDVNKLDIDTMDTLITNAVDGDFDLSVAELEEVLTQSEEEYEQLKEYNKQHKKVNELIDETDPVIKEEVFDDPIFANSTYEVKEAAAAAVEEYETGNISYRELRHKLNKIGRVDRSQGRADDKIVHESYKDLRSTIRHAELTRQQEKDAIDALKSVTNTKYLNKDEKLSQHKDLYKFVMDDSQENEYNKSIDENVKKTYKYIKKVIRHSELTDFQESQMKNFLNIVEDSTLITNIQKANTLGILYDKIISTSNKNEYNNQIKENLSDSNEYLYNLIEKSDVPDNEKQNVIAAIKSINDTLYLSNEEKLGKHIDLYNFIMEDINDAEYNKNIDEHVDETYKYVKKIIRKANLNDNDKDYLKESLKDIHNTSNLNNITKAYIMGNLYDETMDISQNNDYNDQLEENLDKSTKYINKFIKKNNLTFTQQLAGLNTLDIINSDTYLSIEEKLNQHGVIYDNLYNIVSENYYSQGLSANLKESTEFMTEFINDQELKFDQYDQALDTLKSVNSTEYLTDEEKLVQHGYLYKYVSQENIEYLTDESENEDTYPIEIKSTLKDSKIDNKEIVQDIIREQNDTVHNNIIDNSQERLEHYKTNINESLSDDVRDKKIIESINQDMKTLENTRDISTPNNDLNNPIKSEVSSKLEEIKTIDSNAANYPSEATTVNSTESTAFNKTEKQAFENANKAVKQKQQLIEHADKIVNDINDITNDKPKSRNKSNPYEINDLDELEIATKAIDENSAYKLNTTAEYKTEEKNASNLKIIDYVDMANGVDSDSGRPNTENGAGASSGGVGGVKHDNTYKHDKTFREFTNVAPTSFKKSGVFSKYAEVELDTNAKKGEKYIAKVEDSAALRIAVKAQDVKYNFGGKDLENNTIDCSGFAVYVNNQLAMDHGKERRPILKSHNTSAQDLYNYSIETNKPQPGDMAFLYSSKRGKIGHVVVYMGTTKDGKAVVMDARGGGKHKVYTQILEDMPSWSKHLSGWRTLKGQVNNTNIDPKDLL